ncbi:MxaK protein [Methylobacterium goesingense]|nr:MxaK protein [Methylobacterium goesingense]
MFRLGLGRVWGRARPLIIVALPLLMLAVTLGLLAGAWRITRDNAAIRSLAGGNDVAVPRDAAPALLLARVQHLARRGAVEAIEPLIEALDRAGEVERAARARYALANAHLRQAFDLLERGDLDPAGPRITLARQEYRRALQGRPDFWDAKFNLDVASRLLRDFPDFDRKSGDELKAEPKKIWTDIPGQPRGQP